MNNDKDNYNNTLSFVNYNITNNEEINSVKSFKSLENLFHLYFLPLAKLLELNSILKAEFNTNECLSKLR